MDAMRSAKRALRSDDSGIRIVPSLDFSSHLRHKRPHECGRGTQECVRHALIRQPSFEAVAHARSGRPARWTEGSGPGYQQLLDAPRAARLTLGTAMS